MSSNVSDFKVLFDSKKRVGTKYNLRDSCIQHGLAIQFLAWFYNPECVNVPMVTLLKWLPRFFQVFQELQKTKNTFQMIWAKQK